MIKDSSKKVTISVPVKCVKPLEEVCKILGATIISTEYTIKPTIDSWDDLLKYIEAKLGPSYNHKGKDFIMKLTQLSPEATAWFLIHVITGYNDSGKPVEKALNFRLDVMPQDEYTDAVKIVRDNFLPLLHDKGEQKD